MAVRYDETMAGPVPGTVEILAELRGARRAALRAEQLVRRDVPEALARFPFLGWFRGTVISGALRIAKPDLAIYRHLLDTYGLRAEDTVFIDDAPRNVDAAASLGMHAVRFTDAAALRASLHGLGLLEAGPKAPRP